ncbi:MAG: MFS transporter [Pseudomonadota bacterium]
MSTDGFGPALRASLAPVIGMAVAGVSISYLWPLFALLQENEGYSGFLIGLNSTASALTMVVSAPLMPRILARVGLVPLMLISVVVVAGVLVVIPVAYDFWWWTVLRMILGVAGTALFFAAEYWLVEIAPSKSRGRIVAVYAVVLSVSYGVGPIMLRTLGLESWQTFVIPAVIILLSAIPIMLGRRSAPSGQGEGSASPLETLSFFRSDPLILWGVVLFGMIEFGAMGLLSVWGLRSGLAEASALELLTWLAVGSVIFQFVMGWAADKFDRRKLLAVAGAISLITPLLMIQFAGNYPALVAFVVLWGGMAVSLYTLALTELGARYDGPELAAGNAAVVLAYGLGAFAAPAAFGRAMDWIRPDGLLWFAAGCAGAYLLLALIRLSRRARKSLDTDGQASR